MIVTVRAVRMVQVAIHQIIHMVAVRHRFVAAVGAVSVGLMMSRTAMIRRAALRIRRGYLNPVIVHVIAVGIMQMAIM